MHIRVRKVLAGVAGIVFALAGILWGLWGQVLADRLANSMVTRKTGGGDWTFELLGNDSYFPLIMVLGLCGAAGFALAAMLWERRPSYSLRLLAYATLLACLLPISVYNYAHADMLVNRAGQALLNLFLIFGGTLVIAHLYSSAAATRDLLLLQILAIILLALTAVLLPATFSTIWFLREVEAISSETARDIGLPTISTLTGLLSAALAIMKLRKESADKAATERRVVLSR